MAKAEVETRRRRLGTQKLKMRVDEVLKTIQVPLEIEVKGVFRKIRIPKVQQGATPKQLLASTDAVLAQKATQNSRYPFATWVSSHKEDLNNHK